MSDNRKKAFKKNIDSDDARRRREETTIQIRKNKKEERLNQRRRVVSSFKILKNVRIVLRALAQREYVCIVYDRHWSVQNTRESHVRL